MTQHKLPEAFAALEPFNAWCLATETERNQRRVTRPYAEITAFAQAILPQVEAITAYIDKQSAEGTLPDDTVHLYQMLLSLAEVAPAIESYDPQATVIDGYESSRFVANETHCLRPKL